MILRVKNLSSNISYNNIFSWTCLRGQCLDSSHVNRTSPGKASSTIKICEDKWFEDEDDWGENDNDGNGNTDNYKFTSSFLDNMAKSVRENGHNLNNMNANTSATIGAVVRSMECHLNISKVSIFRHYTFPFIKRKYYHDTKKL